MKRKLVKVSLPEKMAEHFSKRAYELGATIMLSYQKDNLFEGDKIIVFVIVDEDTDDKKNLTDFTTEFKAYLKS